MTRSLRAILCGAALLFGLTAMTANAEVTTVLNADFTVLVKGSIEQPSKILSFTTIYDRQFAGYFGNEAYEAGGMLLIKDGGYLSLPRTNLSANGGVYKVILEVKVNEAEMGALTFQGGYTNTQTEYLYDGDWHTVEMMFNGGTSTTSTKLTPFLCSSGLLVKSIKIQQSPEFLVAPTAQQPLVATTTSFTARWRSVSGATGYFLDVYSYNGDDKDYLIENENVGNVTSKAVTGLDASKTYYFVVRSTNGEAVSGDSNEIRVVPIRNSMDTPQNVTVSKGENGDYTVTWDNVEGAVEYIVSIMRKTVTAEEGEAAILSEDFSTLTAGTLTEIEYIYQRHLAALKAPGWTGNNMACAKGIFIFAPYGDGSWVATPDLDLSADNGNVTVKLNMAGGNGGVFNTSEQVTVQLIEGEDTVLSEKTVALDKSGFTEYSVNLTGGTSACKVMVSYAGDYKIYFEDFDVYQLLPAGTEINTNYGEELTETNSFSGNVPVDGAVYTAVITAVGETVSGGSISEIYSDSSEPVVISGTVGIEDVDVDTANVAAAVTAPGEITVVTSETLPVTVYDLYGRVLASATVNGTATLNVGAKGVVVVLAGNKAFKLAL